MEERLVLCGNDKIGVYELPETAPVRRTALEGASAVCAGRRAVYCAGAGGGVWRLDAQTLMPCALFAGGPGIRQMRLSQDGRKLYLLCAEADSLLMLHAHSGEPRVLCRAGVNPGGFFLDEDGGVIAVAGGACGEVLLLDADTLCLRTKISMPGPVHAALLHEGWVYALCLNEALDTTVVSCRQGTRQSARMRGMPGAMMAGAQGVLAAAEGQMALFAGPALHRRRTAEVPGRAKRLIRAAGRLYLLDESAERLHVFSARTGRFVCVCADAADAAYME